MLLSWKKFLLKVIIIAVHALILGALFFPQLRQFFKGEKEPAPEVQPTPSPATPPVLEDPLPESNTQQPD